MPQTSRVEHCSPKGLGDECDGRQVAGRRGQAFADRQRVDDTLLKLRRKGKSDTLTILGKSSGTAMPSSDAVLGDDRRLDQLALSGKSFGRKPTD